MSLLRSFLKSLVAAITGYAGAEALARQDIPLA